MEKDKLENIFEIVTGKDISYSLLPKGDIPVISHTSENLGVVCFTTKLKNHKLMPQNTLSLGHIGSFNCFYQEKPYYLGTRTKGLIPKEKMSKTELLVYSIIINKERYKYSYGRVAGKRINTTLIPTLKEVKNIIKKENLFFNEINVEKYKNSLNSEEIELKYNSWKTYDLIDLFSVTRGKRLIKQERIEGDLKYVSASKENNGVTDKISNPLFIDKDAIVYTTFGDVFYQEGDFTASDEITILKHKYLNLYNGMFIATLLQKNKFKYAFGRKAFYDKIMKEKIILPSIFNDIENKFEPDWEYMTEYIKSLKYSSKI